MIDTHTHLYEYKFDKPGAPWQGQIEAIDRAIAAGVELMLMPGCSRDDIEALHAMKALRPDNVRIAMALHPTEFGADWREHLDTVLCELRHNTADYVAVGECGIDLYWSQETLTQQMQIFDAQLSLAAELGLPVLIHCRKAIDTTLDVLRAHPGVPAVFHSFEGTVADVEHIRTVGDYYFGINGIVTFKNTTLREALPAIGLDRILLETDSPYLAPVPYRGRRNESAYLPVVTDTIAAVLSKTSQQVCDITTANAYAFIPGLR